jgi:hypothetical protein
MPTYAIKRRRSNEHRAGQFALVIDGMEGELTTDPSQFMEKALRVAIEEGHSPGSEAALLFADNYCQERATIALERVAGRIRNGSLYAHGVPLDAAGFDLKKLPYGKVRKGSEKAALDSFMSRGRLSRYLYAPTSGAVQEFSRLLTQEEMDEFGLTFEGSRPLTEEERVHRKREKDTRRDHAAEWQKNRKALIANRQQFLDKLYRELQAIGLGDKREYIKKAIALTKAEIANLMIGIVNASHGFQYAYGQYWTKQVSLSADDIRIVPCMTNTTADTERDAKDAVSDFTTLDEFDGSGYSTGGQALDNQAVNIDDANDRAEFDADNEAATLSAGTRSIQGNLLISFITDLNSSLPLHWVEYASSKTPDGSTFTVTFDAEGILQMADA